jgi:hypothetical protein
MPNVSKFNLLGEGLFQRDFLICRLLALMKPFSAKQSFGAWILVIFTENNRARYASLTRTVAFVIGWCTAVRLC